MFVATKSGLLGQNKINSWPQPGAFVFLQKLTTPRLIANGANLNKLLDVFFFFCWNFDIFRSPSTLFCGKGLSHMYLSYIDGRIHCILGLVLPKSAVIGLKCFPSLYQRTCATRRQSGTMIGCCLYQPLLQIYIWKWRVELGTISSCYWFKMPDDTCRFKGLFRSGHFTSGGQKPKKTMLFHPCTVLYSVGSVARKLKFTGNPLTLISICCLIPTTHKNTSWE